MILQPILFCQQKNKAVHSDPYLLWNDIEVVRHEEKQVHKQAEVLENIKRGRRAPYDSHSSCPLSLPCLQVSSTPNLIALISQLNMGRQKKDNSHPFWGRIRGISAGEERRDTGGGGVLWQREGEPKCLCPWARFTCTVYCHSATKSRN